jgi:hypothetical protein
MQTLTDSEKTALAVVYRLLREWGRQRIARLAAEAVSSGQAPTEDVHASSNAPEPETQEMAPFTEAE